MGGWGGWNLGNIWNKVNDGVKKATGIDLGKKAREVAEAAKKVDWGGAAHKINNELKKHGVDAGKALLHARDAINHADWNKVGNKISSELSKHGVDAGKVVHDLKKGAEQVLAKIPHDKKEAAKGWINKVAGKLGLDHKLL